MTRKLTVSAHAFSASAKTKIEAKGGTCELITPKAQRQPNLSLASPNSLHALERNSLTRPVGLPDLGS